MKRVELEQTRLPQLFYSNCKELIGAAAKEGAGLFQRLYRQTEEGLPEGTIDVGVLDFDEDVNIIRVILPDAGQEGAWIIYLIYGEEDEPYQYLVVEKADQEGQYRIFGLNEEQERLEYGLYEPKQESDILSSIIVSVLSTDEAVEAMSRKFQEMKALLDQNGLEYYDEEVFDFSGMFEVIGELTGNKLELPELVHVFSQLKEIVTNPEKYPNGRAIMKNQYDLLEELEETKGRLEHKEKMFFAFSVYAACNIISEKDEKKHKRYIGVAEFDEANTIKWRMEEYWSLDPYMFRIGPSAR